MCWLNNIMIDQFLWLNKVGLHPGNWGMLQTEAEAIFPPEAAALFIYIVSQCVYVSQAGGKAKCQQWLCLCVHMSVRRNLFEKGMF